MSPKHSPALEQALAAFHAPALLLRLRERALPDDALLLVRIAAGETEARESASAISGESEAVIVEAAVLFIQQLMFFPGSDSYRVLGVAAQAPGSLIKEHHRWLVRWLHPDRNLDEWDAVYADRVSHAWQDLRTPQRRREYDNTRPSGVGTHPFAVAEPSHRISRVAPQHLRKEQYHLSARTMRRLPTLILGSLIAGAISILAIQYYLTQEDAARYSELAIYSESSPEETAPMPAASASQLEASDRAAYPRDREATTVAPTAASAERKEPPTLSVEDLTAPVSPGEKLTRDPPIHETLALQPKPNLAARAEAPIASYVPIPAPTKATPKAKSTIARVSTPTPVIAVAELPKAGQISAALVPSKQSMAAVEQSSSPTGSVPAAVTSSRSLIDEAAAKQMIQRFRSAYASGNINQVRTLLASRSEGPRDERKSILRAYGELFDSSASREIDLRDASWLTDGDTAILIATYEAWIVPRGARLGRRFTGNIRFDMRTEDGELRIIRLRHDAVGG